MIKKVLYIVLPYLLTFIFLIDVFPYKIDLQDKLLCIIFFNLVPLLILILLLINFIYIFQFYKMISWTFFIVNSLFLVYSIYVILFTFIIDLSRKFPVWKDEKIYLSIKDKNDKLIEQKFYLSYSHFDFRINKMIEITPKIRILQKTNLNALSGKWIRYDFNTRLKDTVNLNKFKLIYEFYQDEDYEYHCYPLVPK
ncbi:MAG: hypothetical protein KA792_04450 [Bacteroidales bacterium]|nr:hypothetical protein [Bacteroidales bacterium]